ncbi:alcohol dehydrogenase catalytic domain-containing protein [Arthrobacter sp. Hor0625]|uniref:alcohol dehydrogenase catalytic domain-containing protein n=1 Tax=Arthrobacter sp. Hor0625 TaxID=3457358 RepID=UPI00403E97A0
MPVVARAAVHTGQGAEGLEIMKVTVRDPGPGQVLVRMGASGVCGSDRHVLDGDWTLPSPTVLGHEGAGTVELVGDGVETLAVGDRVVMTWFYPCQACSNCIQGKPWVCTGSRAGECLLPDGSSAMEMDGAPAFPYLAVGSMSEYATVPEQAAIKIPDLVPFEVAALIGCSVATGVGAVVNDAQVIPGRSAVVIGAGGVGLCIIMGLALAGANPIIAADIHPESLELAKRLGATHTVISGDDLPQQIRALTGTGADYAFEAIGRPQSIAQMPACLTSGGTAVIVGLPPEDSPVHIDALEMAEGGKRLLGSNYGSTVPARDFPLLAGLYLNGKLPLDELITKRFELDDVNDAFQLMRSGARGRSVITF